MNPVFGLVYQTPGEWVARIETDPAALLSDHAHCELQAAVSAQTLIGKNPDKAQLVESMSEVATEEMQHFTQVVRTLYARGSKLQPQLPNPYAEALISAASRERKDALLDRLIVAALIEARSLERFHLLATNLTDQKLAGLYAELVPSEAAHHGLFMKFARELFDPDVADARAQRLTELEGEIVSKLPFAHRMHSGVGEPG